MNIVLVLGILANRMLNPGVPKCDEDLIYMDYTVDICRKSFFI